MLNGCCCVLLLKGGASSCAPAGGWKRQTLAVSNCWRRDVTSFHWLSPPVVDIVVPLGGDLTAQGGCYAFVTVAVVWALVMAKNLAHLPHIFNSSTVLLLKL